MKKCVFKVIIASFFLASAGHAGVLQNIASMVSKQRAQVKTVKILLAHGEAGATIGVDGKYKVYDPHTKKVISTRGKTKYMQPIADGLKWAEEFPGTFQLQLIPVRSSGTLTVNGVPYKGSLYVYNVGGQISIVNETTIEDYVTALLASTVSENVESETLNALAIVARTHALYQAEHPRNQYWSIDATQVGFKGHGSLDASPVVAKAVHETHDLALTLGQETTTHFPAEWTVAGVDVKDREPAVFSRITLDQADGFAKQGLAAPDILTKAFPGAKLQAAPQ